MFRKLCMLIALALAVCGAFVSPGADAQGTPECAGALIYGPVVDPPPTPAATTTPAPSGTPGANFSAGTDSDTIVGEANAEPFFVTKNCADAIAYPGPFTTMPTVPASAYAAPRGIAAPATTPGAPVATTPVTGPDLAHSGSEVVVLGYLGTGLLAFGAVALGVRRGGFVE